MVDEFAFKFWSRMSKGHGANDCWFLKSARDGSLMPERLHTVIYFNKRSIPAHRVSYFLTYGSIPSTLVVRHRCANGGCCNPEHLILGTLHENILDTVARRRANIERGELATYEDLRQYLDCTPGDFLTLEAVND